jgi:hypothetical protein
MGQGREHLAGRKARGGSSTQVLVIAGVLLVAVIGACFLLLGKSSAPPAPPKPAAVAPVPPPPTAKLEPPAATVPEPAKTAVEAKKTQPPTPVEIEVPAKPPETPRAEPPKPEPPPAKPAEPKPAEPKKEVRDAKEPGEGDRYGKFTYRVAQGPHLEAVAATFFGSEGAEEFVDAGALPDGTLVAFGNAWGPAFPSEPAPVVLGRGQHTGQPLTAKDKKGREALRRDSPDIAGFIVLYASDLGAIRKVVRFDWGVASILAGRVAADGKGLVVAGRSSEAFRAVAGQAPLSKTAPPPAGKTGADVYIARLTPEGKPEWVWILEKNGDPPERFWMDEQGAVYFDAQGMTRISADGKELKKLSPKTQGAQEGWVGVHPKDGSVYFGGSRNTNTGREPYRQPFLYKYDAEGQQKWKLFEPNPKEISSAPGAGHLESDSMVRALDFAPNGDMLIAGWSDGGNSVFPRQATDWHKPATGAGMGMSAWGMRGANSLGHIMRLDSGTLETKAHSWLVGYIPQWFSEAKSRNAPNHISLVNMRVLGDGTVALTGRAATGLIQTPSAFWTDPKNGGKYGGEFVTVFNEDLTNLRFSSYMPGCKDVRLGVAPKGLLVVSRSKGSDGNEPPTKSPAVKALQGECKGPYDGHIVLLRSP